MKSVSIIFYMYNFALTLWKFSKLFKLLTSVYGVSENRLIVNMFFLVNSYKWRIMSVLNLDKYKEYTTIRNIVGKGKSSY